MNKIQVTGIRMVGSAYRNGYKVPGWTVFKLDDGTEWVTIDIKGFDSACDIADKKGYDTKQMRQRLDAWVQTGKMPQHI